MKPGRGDPEGGRPITVSIHWLSAAEYERFTGRMSLHRKKDNTVTFPNQQAINQEIISKNIRNVRNYDVIDRATSRKTVITDGKTLFESGELELREELLTVINDLSLINEGEVGNLKRRFGGTAPSTNPSAGTVGSARTTDGT